MLSMNLGNLKTNSTIGPLADLETEKCIRSTESRLKREDYLKSESRASGQGCNLTEQAPLKVTGRVEVFKYPEEKCHFLPE